MQTCARTVLTSTKLQYLFSPWYTLGVEFHKHCEMCEAATLWILATSCRLCVRAECLKPLHVQCCLLACMRVVEARTFFLVTLWWLQAPFA